MIAIYTAGGTIDKIYFDANSEYSVGEPQIADILAAANVTVDFRVERLLQKDSLDMTDDDRQLIVDRVRKTSEEKILITHGTDTMVLTGRALEDLDASKTIVLVGSLNPARFKESDALFNIGFAFAAVQTLHPGVYIAMNGQVFSPSGVQKNREKNRFERTG